MSVFKSTVTLSGLALLLSKVSAHGLVSGIIAEGVWYEGYSPSFVYASVQPVLAAWSIPEDSNWGYVSNYTSEDIVCHVGATQGQTYVNVTAGDTIELQWTDWPEGHKGPVIDYLARCTNDDCTSVDKSTLLFNKIDEKGLIAYTEEPGIWAADELRENNNTWFSTIPSTIAPGKYVLRHEIIALHQALQIDGAQNYPQCINLEISGSGSDDLSSGTLGTSLYKDTDPGLYINIYNGLTNYTIPGPAIYSGAVDDPQPSVSGGSWSDPGSTAATASTSSASSYEAATTSTSQGRSSSASSSASVTSSSQEWSAWSSGASSSSLPSYSNTTTVASATRSEGVGPKPTGSSSSSSSRSSSSNAGGQFYSQSDSADAAAPTWTETSTSSSSTDASSAESSTSATGTSTSSNAPVAGTSTSASTESSSAAHTSTVTGNIGQSTDFVCYLYYD